MKTYTFLNQQGPQCNLFIPS